MVARNDRFVPEEALARRPDAIVVSPGPGRPESAGRTIETDYASPGRTTVIASTHRLFSIAEKSAPGDGVFPREALEAAARALSRRFVGFDGLALARRHQTEVNALLLGALAACAQ